MVALSRFTNALLKDKRMVTAPTQGLDSTLFEEGVLPDTHVFDLVSVIDHVGKVDIISGLCLPIAPT